MKFYILLILLFMLYSCSTWQQGEQTIGYEAILVVEKELPLELWPLPDIDSYYLVYLPINSNFDRSDESYPIPPWLPRDTNQSINPDPVIIEESVTTSEVPAQVEPEPVPQQISAPEPSPAPVEPYVASVVEEKKETVISGDNLLLSLTGSGWDYMENDRDAPKFKLIEESRDLNGNHFLMEVPEEGSYSLDFSKWDNSLGKEKILRYIILVEPASFEDTLVENNPAHEQGFEIDEAANNHKDQSNWSLISTNDISKTLDLWEKDGRISDAISLLDNALSRSLNEEDQAEFLYRLARLLELRGQTQNLDRSYRLYEAIVSQFILSSYYDLAEERIRYLDRHYYKLQ